MLKWRRGWANRKWVFGAFLVTAVGLAASIAAEKPLFSVHQKAAYLNPEAAAFIRPGLTVKVTGVTIADDGTVKASFTLKDPAGMGLDRLGIDTPGPVSTSFILARIPSNQSQYVAYTTRPQTSPITNVSTIQAGTDSGGTYAETAKGAYVYTFRTKLPPGYERNVTHAVGLYSTRNLSEFELGNEWDDDIFAFVPDGSEVKVRRDVTPDAKCNACHGQLALHGGPRRTVEVCNLCHTQQTIDPDTGNTMDMKVLIHKIHMGEELPSVQAGTPYVVIGNQQSRHDYSEIAFPANTRNCEACHYTSGDDVTPSQKTAHLTNPSRVACGSCHDNVNFATGENHADLPQFTDNQCKQCHTVQGELEFDLSIRGAHTIARFSKDLPGVVFGITAVSDAAPGKKPTVTFTIKDKQGNPIEPSQMTRLGLVLAGNTVDYGTMVSEDGRIAQGSSGTYFYTFAAALPANASGTWTVGIEGYKNATLLPGTTKEQTLRDAGVNVTFDFPVTGDAVVKRRQVVSLEKCNACHFSLSLHGDNRNTIEQCVLCHNPTGTDSSVRPAAEGAAESINMAQMIHKIHTGEELAKPYVVYGRGSSRNDFSHVLYPNDRRRCDACHVNGSEQLPLQEGIQSAVTPRDYINPQPPATGACLGCHGSLSAAAHADINTSKNFGESCAVCHGPNGEASINRVHAQ